MPVDSTPTPPVEGSRTFLCVVDESEELTQALRFACRRAMSTEGNVALLYVVEPAEFQHFAAIGNLMREERREEAEEMLQVVASVVQKQTGRTPAVYIREGSVPDALVSLFEEGEGIHLLVLGAATGPEGPGPLVSHIVEKMAGRLPVPITIVPGNLSDAEIDALS
jgi:nucleotide-binding universal stress UspA family protein